MKSLTLRGLLWVIGTFTSAYHNYYLSEVWDVFISPNPNSYFSELKKFANFYDKRFGYLTLCLDIAITLFHLGPSAPRRRKKDVV